MTFKELSELRNLSLKDLTAELALAHHEHYKLRLDIGTNQSNAIHKLRALKKYVARLETVKSAIKSSI
ncbi:MAG: 50S ribosomal protein L29 [Patescibacteria group bacterium]